MTDPSIVRPEAASCVPSGLNDSRRAVGTPRISWTISPERRSSTWTRPPPSSGQAAAKSVPSGLKLADAE